MGRLAYEAACADLGATLGIDGKGFRIAFNLGSLLVSTVGILFSFVAMACAPSWKKRVGAFLPGALTNGLAMFWFFLH